MPDYEEDLPPLEYVNAKGERDAWMLIGRLIVVLALAFLGGLVLLK